MAAPLTDWEIFNLPFEPLNEQFAKVLPRRLQRTPFEQGLPRQRRTMRNGPTQYQCTWPFTPDQYWLWEGFYDMVDGQWFTVPVFDATGYNKRAVQIVDGSVSVKREGGEWIVSCVLETMERTAPAVTDIGAYLITAGSDQSLEDIVDLLHQIVHHDIPEAW